MPTPNLPSEDRDVETLRAHAMERWVPLADCAPGVLEDVADMVKSARERGLLPD